MRIRPMETADCDAVVRVWHAAGRAAYDFIPLWQSFTLEQARVVFDETVARRCRIWVAESGSEIVGFLAMSGSYLDRLYVAPERQRAGVGTALLRFAMAHSPTGLELHTHQRNTPARVFYQRQGFVAVRYGVSPPPECEPDVEYHWRPVAPAT